MEQKEVVGFWVLGVWLIDGDNLIAWIEIGELELVSSIFLAESRFGGELENNRSAAIGRSDGDKVGFGVNIGNLAEDDLFGNGHGFSIGSDNADSIEDVVVVDSAHGDDKVTNSQIFKFGIGFFDPCAGANDRGIGGNGNNTAGIGGHNCQAVAGDRLDSANPTNDGAHFDTEHFRGVILNGFLDPFLDVFFDRLWVDIRTTGGIFGLGES